MLNDIWYDTIYSVMIIILVYNTSKTKMKGNNQIHEETHKNNTWYHMQN